LRSRRRLILVETEPLPDAAPAAPVYWYGYCTIFRKTIFTGTGIVFG
jgi:hypothetical protein